MPEPVRRSIYIDEERLMANLEDFRKFNERVRYAGRVSSETLNRTVW